MPAPLRPSGGCLADPVWRLFSAVAAGAIAFGALSGPAAADETHHAAPPIGDRAIGLAGAFTAVADDASATYYNPAGLVLQGRASFAAGLTLIEIERLRVSEGYFDPRGGVNLADRSIGQAPSFAAAVLGRRQTERGVRFSLAYSALQLRSLRSFDLILRDAVADTVQVRGNDRSQLHGLSGAISVGSDWSFGVSLYLRIRTREHRELQLVSSDGMLDPNTGLHSEVDAFTRFSRLSASSYALVPRLGALWQLNPSLRLGASVQLPQAPITRTASLREHVVQSQQSPGDNQGTTDLRFNETGGKNRARSPLVLTVGTAAKLGPGLDLSADLSFVAPVAGGREVSTEGNGLVSSGLFFPNRRRRSPVVNGAVGIEWQPSKRFTFRGGLFTDFSSAPPVPAQPQFYQQPRIHRYGLAASLGLDFAPFTFNIGATARFGRGDAVGFVGGPNNLDVNYARRSARQQVYLVSITGAAQIAKAVTRLILPGKETPKPAKPAR